MPVLHATKRTGRVSLIRRVATVGVVTLNQGEAGMRRNTIIALYPVPVLDVMKAIGRMSTIPKPVTARTVMMIPGRVGINEILTS
jgi:hypothetical protein